MRQLQPEGCEPYKRRRKRIRRTPVVAGVEKASDQWRTMPIQKPHRSQQTYGTPERFGGVSFEQATHISEALDLPRELFEWSHTGGRLTKKLTDAQLITCIVVATLSDFAANSNAITDVVKAFGVDMKAVEKTVDAELAKTTKTATTAKKAKAKR